MHAVDPMHLWTPSCGSRTVQFSWKKICIWVDQCGSNPCCSEVTGTCLLFQEYFCWFFGIFHIDNHVICKKSFLSLPFQTVYSLFLFLVFCWIAVLIEDILILFLILGGGKGPVLIIKHDNCCSFFLYIFVSISLISALIFIISSFPLELDFSYSSFSGFLSWKLRVLILHFPCS